MNQVYGLVIGLGTIDRMKIKNGKYANQNVTTLERRNSIPFKYVFGIYWLAYFLPIDPVFENEEEVLQYRISKSVVGS